MRNGRKWSRTLAIVLTAAMVFGTVPTYGMPTEAVEAVEDVSAAEVAEDEVTEEIVTDLQGEEKVGTDETIIPYFIGEEEVVVAISNYINVETVSAASIVPDDDSVELSVEEYGLYSKKNSYDFLSGYNKYKITGDFSGETVEKILVSVNCHDDTENTSIEVNLVDHEDDFFNNDDMRRYVQESVMRRRNPDTVTSISGNEYQNLLEVSELTELFINGNRNSKTEEILDLTGIDKLTKLNNIYAYDCDLDIASLEDTELRNFNAYDCSLSDTTYLEAHKDTLFNLELKGCGLEDSDLPDMTQMTKLSGIDFSNNKLSEIPDFSKCADMVDNFYFEYEFQTIYTNVHLEGNNIPRGEFNSENEHLLPCMVNNDLWMNNMMNHQNKTLESISRNIVMADTYYAYGTGEDFGVPLYIELQGQDFQEYLKNHELVVTVDSQDFTSSGADYYYDVVSGDNDSTCGIKLEGLQSVITEESIPEEGEVYSVSLNIDDEEAFSKDITIKKWETSANPIVTHYTLSPYQKMLPCEITVDVENDDESETNSYQIALIDENSNVLREYVLDELEDSSEEALLWNLYYYKFFNGMDTPEYFGKQNKTKYFCGEFYLNSYLTMGKSYGISCNKVVIDNNTDIETKHHIYTENKVYQVKNCGQIKKVGASASDSNTVNVSFYGNNLDNEKLNIVLKNEDGEEVSEPVSSITHKFTQQEVENLQDSDIFMNSDVLVDTRMSYSFHLTQGSCFDDLSYEVTSVDDYSIEVPHNRKISIENINSKGLFQSIWIAQRPYTIGVKVSNQIPENTVIHAELGGEIDYNEDTNLPFFETPDALAEGTVKNGVVYFDFMTEDQKIFPLDYDYENSYYFIFSCMVDGVEKRGFFEEVSFDNEMRQKFIVDESCKDFSSEDGAAIPFVAYYLKQYEEPTTATCSIQDIDGTETSCQVENVTYQGIPATKFSANIPVSHFDTSKKYIDYQVELNWKGSQEDWEKDLCTDDLRYVNGANYQVVSYNGKFVNNRFEVTFVMNQEIEEEDNDEFFCFKYDNGNLEDDLGVESIRVEGNKIIATNYENWVKETSYQYNFFLTYSDENTTIRPAGKLEGYTEGEGYVFYFKQKEAGFNKSLDAFTGKDMISGIYSINIQPPLELTVKDYKTGAVEAAFALNKTGAFNAEVYEKLKENKLYSFYLRDEFGILVDIADGFLAVQGEAAEEELTLDSITVDSTQAAGEIGSVIDMSQISVSANYTNGTSKSIPVTKCQVSPTTITARGSNTVTVTYQGKSDTFVISGHAAYKDGDPTPTYELNGKTINAFYTDEASRSSEVILSGITDYMITDVALDDNLAKSFTADFDADNQKLNIVLKPGVVGKSTDIANIVKSGVATITVAGYTPKISAYVTIPITYVKPTIVLSNSKMLLKSNEGTVSANISVFSTANNELDRLENIAEVSLKTMTTSLTAQVIDGDTIGLNVTDAKKFKGSKKVTLGVKESNWAEEILTSTKLQVTKKAVKPSFTKTTITVDKGITGAKADAVYNAGSEKTNTDEVTITPFKQYVTPPTVTLTSLDDLTYTITASADSTVKKGTYTYVVKYGANDKKGIKLKVKITETNFAKTIPSAKAKLWKKSCNKMSDGEAGAAGFTITAKTKGTYVSNITTDSEQFIVKPVYDGKRITDVKIYAKPSEIANLKPNKSYKVALKITCASIYDDVEIPVDSTNAKIDKKRIVNVKVKVK